MTDNKKLNLAVVILTFNEEANLEKCLKSVKDFAGEIFVVDSGSTDKTLQIAMDYGASIYSHSFKNQADQMNWALQNVPIKSNWILRLDADEYVTPELADEIQEVLANSPKNITGYFIKRRVFFMGRWIRHGGYYPTWILRLWRAGKAKVENREMDEHTVLLEGRAGKLKNDFVDDNRKSLKEWVAKHNDFSSREARERLRAMKQEAGSMEQNGLTGQPERKRWMKQNFYMRLPIFLRAFLYFLYRYIIRLGFLDGKEGLIFHFLQGCWHQFLIDAKMYEETFKHKTQNIKQAATD